MDTPEDTKTAGSHRFWPLALGACRAFAVASVFVLTASACASSPEAQAQEERIDAVLDQMDESQQANSRSFPQNESEERLEECLVEENLDMRAVLGNVDDTERLRLFNAILACDVEFADLPTFIGGIGTTFEQTVSNQVEVSDIEVACLIEHVVATSDDPARTMIVADSQDDAILILDGVELCFTPEYGALIRGEAGPMAYGDDPRMDLMFDECQAGDMRVCDLLFLNAVLESEYSNLAYECAGEQPASESSCSVDGEYNLETGFADLDAPGLDVLSTDCEEGDLTACDLLWLLAALEDPRGNSGFNCGGRLVTGGLPDCRTALAGKEL